MKFLGSISVGAGGVKSNMNTAQPFSLGGWPAIYVEPSIDGLRVEIGTGDTWQTTPDHAATIPANGIVLVKIPLGQGSRYVLSVANPTTNDGIMRCWGAYG